MIIYVALPMLCRNSPFLLSKEVGMATCVEHHENQFRFVLLPDKEPVWFQMTFPLTFAVTMQQMNMIPFFERFAS